MLFQLQRLDPISPPALVRPTLSALQYNREGYNPSFNTRFRECYTCFLYETKMGIVRILVIFQGRPMFTPTI